MGSQAHPAAIISCINLFPATAAMARALHPPCAALCHSTALRGADRYSWLPQVKNDPWAASKYYRYAAATSGATCPWMLPALLSLLLMGQLFSGTYHG
jgi:hypothetical protein